MIQQNDIEKLVRFSKGLSDAEESRYVYSLFAEKEDSDELKYYLKDEWKKYLETHEGENYNLSWLLDRIHHRIHVIENRKKQTLTRKIYRWYSVAAAVLLVPLLIAGGIWFTKQPAVETVFVTENPVTSTIHAPLGSRISFNLPDGTRGWLNSGSSLEYQLPFRNNRQITVKGEAWFDVAGDASHPFEISAGRSKVKVLGTKFNLNAYPEEKYVEVVLEEGKVAFSVPGSSCVAELKPNERLIYNNDSVHIAMTDPSKYAAWVEGKLMFRGDPMPEVARRIARWYNVEVELADKDLETDVIRGTFQDDSLEEVLRYMSMTSPIRYRIIDRKILDDGTFQKKKVLLYRRNI
jgi:ferric-dicitrate binding protein FerR (iron transport regulator)